MGQRQVGRGGHEGDQARRRRSTRRVVGVVGVVATVLLSGLASGTNPADARTRVAGRGFDRRELSFGGLGWVATPVSRFDNRARGIAVQPDGRVVVTGNGAMGFVQQCFEFVRYETDGSVDETFGEDGQADLDLSEHLAWPYDLAILPDGSILTGGFAELDDAHNRATGFTRLRADGSPDPNFGTGGQILSLRGTIHSISPLADGRFLAAGYDDSVGHKGDLVVDRHLEDGSIDPTFGVGGRVRMAPSRGFDRANGMVVQPDGRIVVVGSSKATIGYDWVVYRFLEDGALDPDFGTAGLVRLHVGAATSERLDQYDEAFDVALDAAGRIVVTGNAFTGRSNDVVVARLTTEGALDPTFGQSGLAVTDVAGGDDRARNVAVLPDGRIFVAGSAELDDHQAIAGVMYDADGHVVTTWGEGGVVALLAGWGDSYSRAMAVTSDGSRAYLAGFTYSGGGNRFAVAAVRL